MGTYRVCIYRACQEMVHFLLEKHWSFLIVMCAGHDRVRLAEKIKKCWRNGIHSRPWYGEFHAISEILV